MDELVRWLGEQLEEDARIARAASDGPWRAAAFVVEGDGWTVCRAADIDVTHIARHDPARVLREIDAKRQILALHRPVARRSTGSGGGTVEDCSVCGHFPAQFPCLTLRLLALPYADRPGYREQWRP